jgi:hypothetical protein
MIETVSPLNFLTGLISSAWAKSNDDACLVPAALASGSESFYAAVGAWGMVAAAEAPHRCA